MFRFLCTIPFALAIAACGGRPPLQSTSTFTVVSQESELPPPSRTDLTAKDRPSLIGPLDTIAISVFNVPELDREAQVDASGRISMPLIGAIEARGRTAAELAELIESNLRGRFVKNPSVSINIKNSVSQVVTVDGEVEKPGLYPVTNQMTLSRAIASASGLTEFAEREEVVVMRTVDGRRMAGLYSLEAIRRGIYGDPEIYANDIVIVGDSPQRRIFKDLVSVAPLLAAPLIAIVQ